MSLAQHRLEEATAERRAAAALATALGALVALDAGLITVQEALARLDEAGSLAFRAQDRLWDFLLKRGGRWVTPWALERLAQLANPGGAVGPWSEAA